MLEPFEQQQYATAGIEGIKWSLSGVRALGFKNRPIPFSGLMS